MKYVYETEGIRLLTGFGQSKYHIKTFEIINEICEGVKGKRQRRKKEERKENVY